MFGWLSKQINNEINGYHDINVRPYVLEVKSLRNDILDIRQEIKDLSKEVQSLKIMMEKLEPIKKSISEYHDSLKAEAHALAKYIDKIEKMQVEKTEKDKKCQRKSN